MEPKIIYEDEVLLVLDKPAGWVVDKSTTSAKNPVIETWLKQNYSYEISTTTPLRSGVVHRLDKETSGVLLIAKTKKAQEFLQRQFKARKVEKEYLTLIHGKLFPKEGIIKLPVGRLPWNKTHFGILPGGRESQTGYRVMDYYKKNEQLLTLVSVKPKTGRTHQIRIHFKYLNHPLVSDSLYTGRKLSREDRLWCPRLFLHARKIRFSHPVTLKKVEFAAKLPADLGRVLQNLQKLS